ncbi:serine/threonine-protein kinase [Sporobolomyces koalae]|uniref:serine/threonine-protein kinase n=1 Tax=Sporobolomyces koalae TaxID=500713 RepID=UPI00317E5A64
MSVADAALGHSSSSGGISRSSRLDSLSSFASGGTSPEPHPLSALSRDSTAPTSPWTAPSSLTHSPNPASSPHIKSPSLAPPPASPDDNGRAPSTSASTRSASSSSSKTNAGFQVTSRTRNYVPPLSPGLCDALPLPPASSSSAVASGSFFPPTGASFPFPFASTSDAIAQGYLGRRGSSPAAFRDDSPAGIGGASGEPKTTLTLSSSIDSKGRRMVNQYVRLKTIGQGSHGKVWLCAEPSVRESSEEDEGTKLEEGGDVRDNQRRHRGAKHARSASERWEEDIDEGRVRYCAIKSVARDGPGRHKSLRMAKNRKASTQGSGGIGADDKVKREVAIMKRLDHPNIVRLKEVIDDVKSKKVFMVLEFMAGGQVVWQDDNKQPTLTVDEARRTFRDVVLGLEYLHYQGIIHRDIKPANLLWTEDHSTVKISDFGVSHVSDALLRASPDDTPAPNGEDDKALRKTAGSPAFFAPELCHPAEYTPTPTAHPSQPHLPEDEGNAYFPSTINSSSLQLSSHNMVYTPPTSPNGIPLTSKIISPPLPPQSPSQPRTRPPVGKGIDVWALGVTLYCLLFGDTPFTARTEYELYNVIVHESIRVPQRMGVEKAWTGVGSGWDGCGEGTEGREVIDLLGRLLEKDPTKRITLEQVKTHPWVLRNLSSPGAWLDATDPAQTDHVVVTEEDLQHATQERGMVDTLPPIRNRPGIRRALNAALARFPAFSRIKSTRTNVSTNSDEREPDGRSRSKSNSSTGHSVEETHTGGSASVSRQPSDAAASRKKDSHEFVGADFRRVISSSAALASTPRSPSPAAPIGLRGGLGNRSIKRNGNDTVPHSPALTHATAFPELSRSVSSSSVAAGRFGPAGRSSHFARFLGSSKQHDDSRVSPPPGSPSLRGVLSSSPNAISDAFDQSLASTPSGQRHRTLTKMFSRFGSATPGGTTRSRTVTPASCDSQDMTSIDSPKFVPSDRVLEQFESREHYDAFGRTVRKSHDRSSNKVDPDEDEGGIDLTEFEYSDTDPDDDFDDDEDDSDLDELQAFDRPLASADHFSGWNAPNFADFTLGTRAGDDPHSLFSSPATPPTGLDSSPDVDPLEAKQKDATVFAQYNQATPKAQSPAAPLALRTDLPPPPPTPVFSLSAASPVETRAAPLPASPEPLEHRSLPPVRRDSALVSPVLDRKWSGLAQEPRLADDDDMEEELVVVTRRRRAPTIQQAQQQAPSSV